MSFQVPFSQCGRDLHYYLIQSQTTDWDRADQNYGTNATVGYDGGHVYAALLRASGS